MLAPPRSRQALQRATALAARASAHAESAAAAGENDRAAWARARVLADLPGYLTQLEAEASAHGIAVQWADGAQEANRLVIEALHAARGGSILRNHAPLLAEINLDGAAAANSITLAPLHLGDSLVQMAGTQAGHPTWPAVHLQAATVGEVLQRQQRLPFMQDPDLQAAALRAPLRRSLVRSTVAVLGLNFAVAETGSLVCLDSDGHNASLAAMAQHLICLLSIEQVVADAADLHRLAAAYARSAWGRAYPPFVTQLVRPRAATQITLILVDNGRSRILAEDAAEILRCIHCGACHNVCPLFPPLGAAGFAPSAYSGPLGAVLNPSLLRPGLAAAQAHLSTGCAACRAACPVAIDLPALLHLQRQQHAAPNAGWRERAVFWLWQRLLPHPALFFPALRLARRLRWR